MKENYVYYFRVEVNQYSSNEKDAQKQRTMSCFCFFDLWIYDFTVTSHLSALHRSVC